MSGSRKPRLLTPLEAKNSLASRMSRIADRGSQLETRFGLRPYVVTLCWTRWTGDERGDGNQVIVCRHPILPVPVVEDLSAVPRLAYSAGRYPNGSIRVRSISATYRREVLEGRVLPDDPEKVVPQPYDFFWEVTEDGRHGVNPPPLRRRFQPASEPFLDAENQQWIVILQKQSGDMGRDGKPVDDPSPDVDDPWRSRRLEGPKDEDF
jgi:hypothetical protein